MRSASLASPAFGMRAGGGYLRKVWALGVRLFVALSQIRLTRMRRIVGVLCAGALVIVLNALVLQKGKHPAPMFRNLKENAAANRGSEPIQAVGVPLPPMRPLEAKPGEGRAGEARSGAKAPGIASAAQADKTRAEPNDVLIGEIQSELARRGFYKGEIDSRVHPALVQAIREFQFANRLGVDGKPDEALLMQIIATKVSARDEIADVIARAKTAGEERSLRGIQDLQRALNKAGFGPIAEDGAFGPSSKAALMRFEVAHNLPQKGEPRGAVIRALSVASGVAIAP